MSKTGNYKPRHKPAIEEVDGCKCLIVDNITVPYCDCIRHTKYGYNTQPYQVRDIMNR